MHNRSQGRLFSNMSKCTCTGFIWNGVDEWCNAPLSNLPVFVDEETYPFIPFTFGFTFMSEIMHVPHGGNALCLLHVWIEYVHAMFWISSTYALFNILPEDILCQVSFLMSMQKVCFWTSSELVNVKSVTCLHSYEMEWCFQQAWCMFVLLLLWLDGNRPHIAWVSFIWFLYLRLVHAFALLFLLPQQCTHKFHPGLLFFDKMFTASALPAFKVYLPNFQTTHIMFPSLTIFQMLSICAFKSDSTQCRKLPSLYNIRTNRLIYVARDVPKVRRARHSWKIP